MYKRRTERLKEKYGGSCISNETREKLSENSKKIKHPCSEETKRKISQANKGKTRVGHKLTEEQKSIYLRLIKVNQSIKREDKNTLRNKKNTFDLEEKDRDGGRKGTKRP